MLARVPAGGLPVVLTEPSCSLLCLCNMLAQTTDPCSWQMLIVCTLSPHTKNSDIQANVSWALAVGHLEPADFVHAAVAVMTVYTFVSSSMLPSACM